MRAALVLVAFSLGAARDSGHEEPPYDEVSETELPQRSEFDSDSDMTHSRDISAIARPLQRAMGMSLVEKARPHDEAHDYRHSFAGHASGEENAHTADVEHIMAPVSLAQQRPSTPMRMRNDRAHDFDHTMATHAADHAGDVAHISAPVSKLVGRRSPKVREHDRAHDFDHTMATHAADHAGDVAHIAAPLSKLAGKPGPKIAPKDRAHDYDHALSSGIQAHAVDIATISSSLSRVARLVDSNAPVPTSAADHLGDVTFITNPVRTTRLSEDELRALVQLLLKHAPEVKATMGSALPAAQPLHPQLQPQRQHAVHPAQLLEDDGHDYQHSTDIAAEESPLAKDSVKLPSSGGWVQKTSPDGRSYYENANTGATTWFEPAELKAAHAAQARFDANFHVHDMQVIEKAQADHYHGRHRPMPAGKGVPVPVQAPRRVSSKERRVALLRLAERLASRLDSNSPLSVELKDALQKVHEERVSVEEEAHAGLLRTAQALESAHGLKGSQKALQQEIRKYIHAIDKAHKQKRISLAQKHRMLQTLRLLHTTDMPSLEQLHASLRTVDLMKAKGLAEAHRHSLATLAHKLAAGDFQGLVSSKVWTDLIDMLRQISNKKWVGHTSLV